MTLQDFEAEIRNAVNHVCYPDAPPADIRPFVCSGRNPLVRKVFIVGENAATPMPGTDFWKDFWDNAGSKYPDWQQAYDKVRRNEADERLSLISAIKPAVFAK